jgi:subtilisin family serine protease
MKRLMGIVALFLFVTSASGAQQVTPSTDAKPVIVIFREDMPFHQFTAEYEIDIRISTSPDSWSYLVRGVVGATQRLERLYGFKSTHVYSHAIKGFATTLTADQIERLSSDSTIDYIEDDRDVVADAEVIPWGVDHVGARGAGSSDSAKAALAGVNVYVIDSGIASHRDLNLVRHLNFAGGSNTDCSGHGTHVAGTIGANDNAGDVVGVAPGVRLTGIKVLGCDGRGSTSSLIKAVDWVTANAVKPAVANISMGSPASRSVDAAVQRSARSNVLYAVAAGNDADPACTRSPARAGYQADGDANGVITTASVDRNDREAASSNYGRCVDVWAPGVQILSTRAGGGTTTKSGTSMAAPHVAGIAALYMATNRQAPSRDVEAVILSHAVSTGTSSKDGQAIQLARVVSQPRADLSDVMIPQMPSSATSMTRTIRIQRDWKF